MKMLMLLGMLAGMLLLGLAAPAKAQTVPDVSTAVPFSQEAKYMSLTGYMRWQYFQNNNVWISRAEANRLVLAQIQGRPTALIAQVRREA